MYAFIWSGKYYSLLFNTSGIALVFSRRLDADIIAITPANMRHQINLTQSDTKVIERHKQLHLNHENVL